MYFLCYKFCYRTLRIKLSRAAFGFDRFVISVSNLRSLDTAYTLLIMLVYLPTLAMLNGKDTGRNKRRYVFAQ